MQRLNPDGHDENDWFEPVINPKTGKKEMPPIVNAFRAAKGDIQTNSDAKVEAAHWMPRILNLKLNKRGEKYLDDDQLHICRRVERVALSAMAALGVSNLRCFMAMGSDVAELPKRDPFATLLTDMLPEYSNAMLWVISDERNLGNVELAIKIHGTIVQSLELAKKILDEI